jgi:hypothetical protein
MGTKNVRSLYLRWVYGFCVMSAFMLVVLYKFSGDETGSHDNTGVWVFLMAMAATFALGFALAPRLHVWIWQSSGRNVQLARSGKKKRLSRESASRSRSRVER